ncbi:MAG: PLDc N-terminal domain-containing protein [Cryobacterium sp.]|nr:PLDc N-terminal domain-containing protein [Cryobacterium sp.]
MARVLLIAGVAAAFFTVYAVVDCAVTARERVRGIPKLAWIVVILLLPVVGGILWLIIGKDRTTGRPVRGAAAPDDDPAFLQRIGEGAAREERIRQLEEELAELDDDSKDA